MSYCSSECAVCSVQCAVCSVQCAVCSVQYAVCSETLWRLTDLGCNIQIVEQTTAWIEQLREQGAESRELGTRSSLLGG